MPDMLRVRRFTLPDGSDPFDMDGRVIPTALPQFTTLYLGQPILVDGQDFQSSKLRQFSITFVGKIMEDSVGNLRKFLKDLDNATGMRNRRFYLYDQRFWIVRSEGLRCIQPYPGVRDRYISLELYLRVLDPYFRDEEGNLYRSWG